MSLCTAHAVQRIRLRPLRPRQRVERHEHEARRRHDETLAHIVFVWARKFGVCFGSGISMTGGFYSNHTVGPAEFRPAESVEQNQDETYQRHPEARGHIVNVA